MPTPHPLPVLIPNALQTLSQHIEVTQTFETPDRVGTIPVRVMVMNSALGWLRADLRFGTQTAIFTLRPLVPSLPLGHNLIRRPSIVSNASCPDALLDWTPGPPLLDIDLAFDPNLCPADTTMAQALCIRVLSRAFGVEGQQRMALALGLFRAWYPPCLQEQIRFLDLSKIEGVANHVLQDLLSGVAWIDPASNTVITIKHAKELQLPDPPKSAHERILLIASLLPIANALGLSSLVDRFCLGVQGLEGG